MNKKQKVVIFGNHGIAEVAHFYLTHDSEFEVAGFTVDAAYAEGEEFQGLPLVHFENVEKTFPPETYKMLVAVSYTGLNKVRAEKCREAKQKGYELISYVNSRCTHWPDLKIGENCFVLEDVTIQPFVTIGDNVTIWSGNHIGHHAKIEDNCFITSQVVISGYVVVGQNSFLGVNCTIRDGVKIAERCIIGAGALILRDTEPDSVYKTPEAVKSAVPSHKVRL